MGVFVQAGNDAAETKIKKTKMRVVKDIIPLPFSLVKKLTDV